MNSPAKLSSFDLDRIGGLKALHALVSEILAAGDEAKVLFAQGVAERAEIKPDRSPVTEADRRVEARLRAYCAHHFPSIAFLGEEGEKESAIMGKMRFVVDPIDGTRAFIRGIPTWSVLLGLEVEGEPMLGIAYLPAMEEIFVAYRGGGALGNGRPLRVSSVDDLAQALVCHGALQQFYGAGCASALASIEASTFTQRGFSDFDGYRHVLLGRADAMVDPGVQPWDLCAPSVLIEEAGGRFSDWQGKASIHSGKALASNGRVHDALLQGLSQA